MLLTLHKTGSDGLYVANVKLFSDDNESGQDEIGFNCGSYDLRWTGDEYDNELSQACTLITKRRYYNEGAIHRG